MKTPLEFWLVDGGPLFKLYDNEEEAIRIAGRIAEDEPTFIHHLREVTGPDYKAIAEELMRALEKVSGDPAHACCRIANEALASAKKRLGE